MWPRLHRRGACAAGGGGREGGAHPGADKGGWAARRQRRDRPPASGALFWRRSPVARPRLVLMWVACHDGGVPAGACRWACAAPAPVVSLLPLWRNTLLLPICCSHEPSGRGRVLRSAPRRAPAAACAPICGGTGIPVPPVAPGRVCPPVGATQARPPGQLPDGWRVPRGARSGRRLQGRSVGLFHRLCTCNRAPTAAAPRRGALCRRRRAGGFPRPWSLRAPRPRRVPARAAAARRGD